ncbi:hypothetical protein JOM56_004810 [Amanita muscaria]
MISPQLKYALLGGLGITTAGIGAIASVGKRSCTRGTNMTVSSLAIRSFWDKPSKINGTIVVYSIMRAGVQCVQCSYFFGKMTVNNSYLLVICLHINAFLNPIFSMV